MFKVKNAKPIRISYRGKKTRPENAGKSWRRVLHLNKLHQLSKLLTWYLFHLFLKSSELSSE